MSTRIHNGRLIPFGLIDAYHCMIEVKPQAASLAQNLRTSYLAHRVAKLIDRAAVKGEQAINPVSVAWMELLKDQREVKKTGYRNPTVDFEGELYLFPIGGEVLCIHNTEQPALRAWFDALPFVEDFHYQDAADKPDEISEAEWEWRRKRWDIVLPGAGVPADRGLVLNLVSDACFQAPSDEAVHLALPSREHRIKEAALDFVVAEMVREAGPTASVGEVSAAIYAARHADARRRTTEDWIAPLIRFIAIDDLRWKSA